MLYCVLASYVTLLSCRQCFSHHWATYILIYSNNEITLYFSITLTHTCVDLFLTWSPGSSLGRVCTIGAFGPFRSGRDSVPTLGPLLHVILSLSPPPYLSLFSGHYQIKAKWPKKKSSLEKEKKDLFLSLCQVNFI